MLKIRKSTSHWCFLNENSDRDYTPQKNVAFLCTHLRRYGQCPALAGEDVIFFQIIDDFVDIFSDDITFIVIDGEHLVDEFLA